MVHKVCCEGMVLASGSPRRIALLRQVTDMPFAVVEPEIDESFHLRERPVQDAVRRVSMAKAATVALKRPGSLIITADTVICCDDLIMGKPADIEEAREMLTALRGRRHEAMTGLTVCMGRETVSETVVTGVEMRAFTEEELDLYLATGEPIGKAGAYAIQGRGAVLVAGISGCYYNVVGLPLARLQEILAGFGVNLLGGKL